MYRKSITTNLFIVVLLAVGLFSCKNTPDFTSLSVTVRLPSEPDNLHPVFSRSSYAAQIEALILTPITEFDPVSLTLTPLLITRIPEGEPVTEGPHINGRVYRLEFRPEAVWSDGRPVTGEDYLFTFKSVYNPHYNAGSWKAFMDFIRAVEIDPDDSKKVSVYLDKPYILSVESTTNFSLYPAHIYDPENIMSQFSLDQLRDPDITWTPEQDSLLKRFATLYESPEYFRETVSGAGPYELESWTTGELIRLSRKQDWWGDKVKNPPLLLQAYPTEINYRIILDAAAAEAALKAGEIDIMSEAPVAAFNTLKSDPTWKDKFQFVTPALLQVNYLELNNRDSVLGDPRIRKALAYCIDYDGMVSNVMQGLAERTIGPIHPENEFYNSKLKPIEQDINKALALIREAGWKDTNGNGIPDKIIGGKRKELQLTITTTNREEGLAMANIVKENARKAGIDIVLQISEPGELQQRIRQYNFEMIPLRVQSFPNVYDPYANWHSANTKSGGSNRSGFQSEEMDVIIDQLRISESSKDRRELYHQFQEILYEEQPVIYLYVPKERIIASRRIEILTSSRRPGYFENLMKPSGS